MSKPPISWPEPQHHETLPNTMERARALVCHGVSEGFTVVAREQTDGRGRLGRVWGSPKDDGLYMTVILYPPSHHDLSPLSIVAGIAVVEALTALGVKNLALKWPNDVVSRPILPSANNARTSSQKIIYPGKKLAGILLERIQLPLQCSPRPSCHHAVLVGIGINIGKQNRLSPDQEWFPRYIGLNDLLKHAIATADEWKNLIKQVRTRLGERYQQWQEGGLANMLSVWQKYDLLRGQTVTAMIANTPVTGLCVGITPRGALLLHTDNGVREIASGEVDCVRYQ